MAISVQQLFDSILLKYNDKILTSSCFERSAKWVHYQEDKDFLKYLHGGELILNSTMRLMDDDEKKSFVKGLIDSGAAGCIVATESENELLPLVDLCEENRFPLIWSDYAIPYLDIIHDLTEKLVYEQRNAINREVALRNLILYRGKDDVHLDMLRTDPYLVASSYNVILAGWAEENTAGRNLKNIIETRMPTLTSRSILCEERDVLVVLVTDSNATELVSEFRKLVDEEEDIRIAVGSTCSNIDEIYESYKAARVTYRMIHVVGENPLSYTGLGIFKVLDDIQKGNNSSSFIDMALGRLIRYDEAHGTDYVEILRIFMKNECNVIQSADALYFHRNTMQKKIATIKDILGYDVMLNENRFRIILAMYLMKMKNLLK